MKKIVALMLILTCLVGTMPAALAGMENFTASLDYAGQFADVTDADWFAPAVQSAFELGLMNGVGDTAFRPSGDLTVAEALAIACRLHSIYAEDGAAFEQGEPWYQTYVDYAVENGIMREGQLDPAAKITREQFAYLMCGALPSAELEAVNEIAAIPDVAEQSTYGGFVYRLYRAGVLTGSDRYGTFQPTTGIRRSEVAAIVTRLADKSQRVAFTPEPLPEVAELQLAGATQLGVGESTVWTATPLPAESRTTIAWSSGYPAVATVDENGTITAHRAGDCNITATAENGVKKTVMVHVRDVEEITFIGITNLGIGETTTWTAKTLPEGTKSVLTWTASNESVATVDRNGTITGVSAGDCSISATAENGVRKTVVMHVMSAADAFRAQYCPDLLSSYSSPHTAIAARTNNLILACKAIDGTVLQPGETFSFNGVVGERTAAKGYREAIVYADGGASTPALGGGVCQVASTIYLCTLLADLEVVQRTEHMYAVTYVPMGMDATIYWGSLDYKFRNNTSHPVQIRSSVSGGYVHIKLYGTKETGNTVKMRYTVLSTTPWQEVEQVDNTKPAGYRETTVTPYTGYRVQTYKDIYDASGKLVSSTPCASSTYIKRDKVVTVGPAAQPTTPTIRPPRGR
ncbi:MAG: VanW family protein [Oscillospiraceae bacterium]|nr:VanW family protein [Oscillospiraceae bacterium]